MGTSSTSSHVTSVARTNQCGMQNSEHMSILKRQIEITEKLTEIVKNMCVVYVLAISFRDASTAQLARPHAVVFVADRVVAARCRIWKIQ